MPVRHALEGPQGRGRLCVPGARPRLWQYAAANASSAPVAGPSSGSTGAVANV